MNSIPMPTSPPPQPLGRNPLQGSPPQFSPNSRALDTDIIKGIKLRKAITNDCSGPKVLRSNDEIKGSSVCPENPSLGVLVVSRLKSSTGLRTGGNGCGNIASTAPTPQLAGIFAGGMPKLRSRGGGVDTGAQSSSPYFFLQNTTPSYPIPLLALRQTIPSAPVSSLPLQKVFSEPQKCPISATPSLFSPQLKITPSPPPAYPLAPPKPPIRKVSPSTFSRMKPDPPLAPPPPPRLNPPLPPPPPLLPPLYSRLNCATSPISPALVAARKAAGFPTNPPPLAPAHPPVRDWDDPSTFSLLLPVRRSGSGTLKRVWVDDGRWRFKGDLPEPRIFQGVRKVYKSGGNGSSVPLDLRTLE